MKRFTDTEKWKYKWFYNLNNSTRLLYLYILDNCNNAGFCDINEVVFASILKLEIEDVEQGLEVLADKIIMNQDREILWIKDFIFDQGNFPLSEANNAHKQIIAFFKFYLPKFTNYKNILNIFELRSPLGNSNSYINI